jgi:phosphohistidine swiveling domain-containing protein
MFQGFKPEKYDFVWRVDDFPYLYASIYLSKEFLSRDFIVTYTRGLFSCYISKIQREMLSKQGYTLLNRNFTTYKKGDKRQTRMTKVFLNKVFSQDLNRLSNKEFAQNFQKSIRYIQKRILSLYFWTEYICYDKITKVLEESAADHLQQLRKNMTEMGKLKLKQREYINKIIYPDGVIDRYVKAVVRRLQLKHPFTNYHYTELLQMLHGKPLRIPNRSIIILGKFSQWSPIVGARAKNIIKQLKSFDLHTAVLKGSVGNRGYAKGRVRKINFGMEKDYAKEIHAMQWGEILVSDTTGPELILACKKAAAIVTDEGGIISHAAVISRELKIPCIIGTKIATQVLKDGDLIEVDASKGVVKILKRARNYRN